MAAKQAKRDAIPKINNIINFKNNDTIVRDNYGDIIPVMSYSNNKLESSYSILSNAVIKSVTNINSKEYIEEVAREKLDMYLPNEKVYIDISK